MELDWTTFGFEIINFLVLVWLLSHFLYKPINRIVSQRRDDIDAALQQAASSKLEAEELEHQYARNLKEWEAEKEAARHQFSLDLEAEKGLARERMHAELEQEREKVRVREERKRNEEMAQCKLRAMHQGGAFAARFLRRLADQNLESRLLEMAALDLASLEPSQLTELREHRTSETCLATTAFPLSEEEQAHFQRRVDEILGRGDWRFVVDPEVGAGVRLSLGPWALGACLADELKLFAETAPNRHE